MDKHVLKSLPMVIGGAFAIAWCIIILVLVDLSSLGALGWFAFLFVLFSFALVSFVEPYARQLKVKNDNTAIGLPVFYSITFLVLVVLINSLFLLLRLNFLTRILVAADIALLAIYLALVLSSLTYMHKLKDKSDSLQDQTASVSRLSGKVGEMLSLAKDEKVRKGLLDLKEALDYSTNVPGSAGANAYYEVSSQVQKVYEALQNKANPDDILALLGKAKDAWLSRKASRQA